MENDSRSYGSSEYLKEAKSLKNLFESELSRVQHLGLQLKEQLEDKEEVQQQVSELNQQVSELNQQVSELNQKLKQAAILTNKISLEAKVASEDAELTLLQLLHSQEEAENYFFQSRAKDDLIQQYQAQQQLTRKIISRALNQNENNAH